VYRGGDVLNDLMDERYGLVVVVDVNCAEDWRKTAVVSKCARGCC
jgi:hypothetical protein